MSQIIKKYLDYSDPEIKENANNDFSYSQLQEKIAGKSIRKYCLEEIYPSHIAKAHYNGDIHIHNLTNGISPYCFGADLLGLLRMGLITHRIRAKPPKHLDTAIDQITNYLYATQQEFSGAQAISDVNHLLAPFVKEDRLSYEEVKQNMQRAIYSCNYPGRAGYQSPFINFIFNVSCPTYLEDEPVIIGGEDTGNVYGDYQDEAELILQAFNEVMYGGDSVGNPFTFPIPTLNITKNDRKYFKTNLFFDLFKTDVKYGVWYWMNYLGTGYVPGTKRNMCCRLILSIDEIMTPGGRWAFDGATGSIGVVTINMARIGYLSGGDLEHLFELLDERLRIAKEALMIKAKIIKSMDDKGLFPMSKLYGVNFEKFYRTIGMIGLDEMCLNAFGTPLSENRDIVYQILHHMKEFCIDAYNETGYIFNDELTPGEGSAHSLALKDLKHFPDIIHKGGKDDAYYTALITPPSQELGILERLDIEVPLLNEITGGTVHRIFHGESKPSVDGIRKLIIRILENKAVPYLDYEREYSVCQKDGTYVSGKVPTCPKCGSDMYMYSRIVGYYRPLRNTNPGKKREILDRRLVKIDKVENI